MKMALTPFALAVVLVGCDVLWRPPVALIPPLQSYSSQSAVRAALGNPKAWRIVEDRDRDAKAGAPRYRHAWIEVSGYVFRGYPSVLRLEFFNDRLMTTRLYPADQPTLAKAIAAEVPIYCSKKNGVGIRKVGTTSG